MNKIHVCASIAIDPSGVIGCPVTPDHPFGIPWRHRADVDRFRTLVSGYPVIVGARTFGIIERTLCLLDTIPYIYARVDETMYQLYRASSDANLLIDFAQKNALSRGLDRVWVIGGAETYRVCAPVIDRWFVTCVPKVEPSADHVKFEIPKGSYFLMQDGGNDQTPCRFQVWSSF